MRDTGVMILWTGTSGYQYPEWKGSFYPADMPAGKMLAYYAAQFPTTEINYTFRSLPSEKTITRWREGTPANFRFSLKAPQRVTHFARLRDCVETMTVFAKAVSGLGDKLGPVLFQLPPNFKVDAALLREFLKTMPRGLRAAFEFRHESWFDDEIYDVLKRWNAAFCIADADHFKTPRAVTADFGYLRLRSGDYTAFGIRKWSQFLRGQDEEWSEAFVYFKHEETGSGPRFARVLISAMT